MMRRNGVVENPLWVSGGGRQHPVSRAAEPAELSGEFQHGLWSRRLAFYPRHLLAPHQCGFLEGFLAAELPFVLDCVLRLPENSEGYPKLPSIFFFFF